MKSYDEFYQRDEVPSRRHGDDVRDSGPKKKVSAFSKRKVAPSFSGVHRRKNRRYST